jgi:hypothetical protein
MSNMPHFYAISNDFFFKCHEYFDLFVMTLIEFYFESTLFCFKTKGVITIVVTVVVNFNILTVKAITKSYNTLFFYLNNKFIIC